MILKALPKGVKVAEYAAVVLRPADLRRHAPRPSVALLSCVKRAPDNVNNPKIQNFAIASVSS
jgi:hypothetical protein